AAREHEDPVGLMCERGPDPLPLHAPRAVGFLPAARLHVGQIGTGTGFRIALRPELAAGDDLGQEALLLRRRAELDQRRADQAFADVAHAPRPAGARVFFVEDHLLLDRQAATAVLARPADAGPAAGRELTLPLLAQRRLVLLV